MTKHKDLTTLEWLTFVVIHNSVLFFFMMVRHVQDGWDKTKMWFFIATRQGGKKEYHLKEFRKEIKSSGQGTAEAMHQYSFLQKLLTIMGYPEDQIEMFAAQVLPFQALMYAFDRETADHVHRVKSFETVGDALQMWYDYDEVNERTVRYFFGDDYDAVYSEKSYTAAYEFLEKAMKRQANARNRTTTFTPTGAEYATA